VFSGRFFYFGWRKPLFFVILRAMKEQSELDELYDCIAPRYDLLNALVSFGGDGMVRRKASRMLAPGLLLDVATGSGVSARALRSAHPTATVIGVDRASGMLAVARRNGSGELVRGDVKRLPFQDSSFDGANAGFVFRPLQGDNDMIAEIKRVLKPGGRLVIYDTFRPRRGVIGLLYRIMLRLYIPVCGLLFARKASPYFFFADSIRESISGEELGERLRKAGFDPVETQTMLFGAVTIISAEKSSF
jgi:demethylmenaquinone methyltransferase/2-methoxy-6-polyprenyl-1,4-benzoquinol methylase